MPQVLIWKCPKTNKLFEDKTKYQRHLKQLAQQRRESRKIEIENQELAAWWQEFQNTECDVSDLANLIIQNQKYFWNEARKTRPRDWENLGKSRNNVIFPVPEILEFTKFSLDWSDRVSNTHACPRDGVLNWGGDVKLPDGTPAPRGYPGWQGRVEWLVRWPAEWQGWYPGGDIFDGIRCRIHTGTGGGGGMRHSKKYQCDVQSFGYDVKIFAADWPGPARVHGRRQMWKILSNKGQPA